VQFSVIVSEHYQTVKGFGGAMTDVAGINIASLSLEAQNQLLR
jgi:O-glycosyl hydrolase